MWRDACCVCVCVCTSPCAAAVEWAVPEGVVCVVARDNRPRCRVCPLDIALAAAALLAANQPRSEVRLACQGGGSAAEPKSLSHGGLRATMQALQLPPSWLDMQNPRSLLSAARKRQIQGEYLGVC